MWRRAIVGLSLVAVSAVAAPAAQAQDQSFGVTLGYFVLRSEDGRVAGDVLNANRCIDVTFDCEPLLFDVSDFNGGSIGAEWLFGIGDYLEAGAGIGFSQRTVPSVYEFLQADDGSEIEQELKLRMVPITATIRYVPTGRRSSIQPYIGAGLGLIAWRYTETGSFVDIDTSDIFRASYEDTGTEVVPIILGGIKAPVGDVFAIGGEVRWQRGDAHLSEAVDFVGDRIDLGGITYQAVFHFRF
jgi:Outer membrane protein beta-barrel domain